MQEGSDCSLSEERYFRAYFRAVASCFDEENVFDGDVIPGKQTSSCFHTENLTQDTIASWIEVSYDMTVCWAVAHQDRALSRR
jgi:hypothetical protein